jgi:predicted TPR repeat methyltransferase
MTQAADIADHRVETKDIALPPPMVSMSQDREWCLVEVDGVWRKIRFHDYDKIYAIPGLYEALFYGVLGCNSPAKVRKVLKRCIDRDGADPGELRVLDLGAGNGMVGEELATMGVRHVVGIDIIKAAAKALRRDHREAYDDYFVLDMTDVLDRDLERLSAFGFNCLTCVAALGFGDIPPAAFANAFNLIEQGGWVAFNIKSDFLDPTDRSGFAGLVQRMIESKVISIRESEEYPHRRATTGEPLPYTVVVGVKHRDIPVTWDL